MRYLRIITSVLAIAATLSYVVQGILPLAAAVFLPAVGLPLSVASQRARLAIVFEIVLIVELLGLGAIWPSPFTIVAILALPAFPLGIWIVIKDAAWSKSSFYVSASALSAAACMLAQGLHLYRQLSS